MREDIEAILETARSDGHISCQDIVALLQLDIWSKEAFAVRWVARELAVKACGREGRLYAQIGIDAGPCSENCRYCSFAACNYDPEEARGDLSLETVVKMSRLFDEAGIHWISLMTTADYDFTQYLELVRAVRDAVAEDVKIMSNIGDIDLGQALLLKEAGVAMAYHAPRIGEGVITDLSLERRFNTLDAIRDAGLMLATGVGPLRRGTDLGEIAERIEQLLAYDLYCAGTTTLTVVPGTQMGDELPPTQAYRRYVACVFRLAAGLRVPFGNFNTAWADAGARPRGQEHIIDPNDIKRRVDAARKVLEDDEWHVLDRGGSAPEAAS